MKLCTGMTDIKIRIVVNSREKRRDDGTRKRCTEGFQRLCNVFFYKIISK